MTSVTQRTFASGELDPALHARTDYFKYSNGLRTCKNNIIKKHGGATNRAGTLFCEEVSTSSENVRSIDFVYSNSLAYSLEFSESFIRVIKDGAYLYKDPVSITDVSSADPAIVTSSHDLVTGDIIYFSDIIGMTELNGRYFKVEVTSSTEFKIKELYSDTNLDTTSYSSYVSGGTYTKALSIQTEYLDSEIFDLQYVQSNDILTIVHQNHSPLELKRYAEDDWRLEDVILKPDIDRPKNISASGSSGSVVHRYMVTAISSEDFEESLPGYSNSNKCRAYRVSGGNPCQWIVEEGSYAIQDNDKVYAISTDEDTLLAAYNGILHQTFTADRVGSGDIKLLEYDGSEGSILQSTPPGSLINHWLHLAEAKTTALAASDTDPVTVSWSRVSGAIEYNVYKRDDNGVFGLLGISKTTSFKDIGEEIDTTKTPPNSRNPFILSGDKPASVTYIQQRLCFGGTENNPSEIQMSKIGNFKNFTRSSPLQDDDAVKFNLLSRNQSNDVKHMLDLGRFVVLTSGGEWAANGDGSGFISPTTINPKQYTYNGSSNLAPVVIGHNAIYQQARGSVIRDLGYDYSVDGYRGNDLSLFSGHLFKNKTIVDWAFQQTPNSVLWCVRDDGKLLGLTYVKDQQVIAWHQHETDGKVKSVSVIPENNADTLYLVVERIIDGNTRKFIERMDTEQYDDISDSVYMDSALKYNGVNTDTTHTMTLSGGTDWTYEEEITLTSSESYFSSDEVGNEIVLNYSDSSNRLRCKITEYTSATQVKIKPHKTVIEAYQGTAITDWSRAVDEVSGLSHLEGKEVSILADGNVLASPYNSSIKTFTVSGGKVNLSNPYSKVTVGLPYISDLVTLDIDNNQGESLTDKQKLISSLTLHLYESRGGFVGKDLSNGDDKLLNLNEIKIDEYETYEDPQSLFTGKKKIVIDSKYNDNGRVSVRQVDPLPMTILAITPSGYIPFNGG